MQFNQFSMNMNNKLNFSQKSPSQTQNTHTLAQTLCAMFIFRVEYRSFIRINCILRRLQRPRCLYASKSTFLSFHFLRVFFFLSFFLLRLYLNPVCLSYICWYIVLLHAYQMEKFFRRAWNFRCFYNAKRLAR